MPAFITAEDAIDLIRDNSSMLTVGFTLSGASEDILKALEQEFLATGSPSGLTLVHAAGQSDTRNGIEHLAHRGLLKRVIGSHWGLAPRMSALLRDNGVEGFCLPQGQLTHLFRAMAGGCPGVVTRVGLGTFVDPRFGGGRINERAPREEELVSVTEVRGQEHLLYHSIPIDIAIVRGTTADERGNISMEEEALELEVLPAALAARRYGGKVVAQVKRVARCGTLHPKAIVVPGAFVDYVVVSRDPHKNHRQTACCAYDPSFSGDLQAPVQSVAPLPLSPRKVIGRRAMMELWTGAVVNIGTGIPGDVFGPIANEEGIQNDVTPSIESGVIGGIPMGGTDFGIARNTEAIIEHTYQFDYYNGAGVDATLMGAAEIDEEGNVNVSRFGDRLTGCGGFIDITQPAKTVVFCATFTAGDLRESVERGRIVISVEGSKRKFVRRVQHLTFSGRYASTSGQRVVYVTERAVFRLEDDGLVLTEVAPGIDVERDVLGQMEFKPMIAAHVREMDARIFGEGPMGLSLQTK